MERAGCIDSFLYAVHKDRDKSSAGRVDPQGQSLHKALILSSRIPSSLTRADIRQM